MSTPRLPVAATVAGRSAPPPVSPPPGTPPWVRWVGWGALAVAVILLGRCVVSHVHRPRFLNLAYQVVGPDPRDARRVFVFLHGYGGSIDHVSWLIEELHRRVGADVSFVMIDGPFAGRGGRTWGDAPSEHAESLERLRELFAELFATHDKASVVVSGFSQGAMIAYRLAAAGDVAKTAVLLSGCAYGVPADRADPSVRYVFIHGERDRICAIGPAAELATTLADRGVQAEMISFPGDHEVGSVARYEVTRALTE